MRAFRLSFAALLCGVAAAASAHDTWFRPLESPVGVRLLALGTGNRYPVHETGVGAPYLARQGCAQGGQASAMEALRNDPRALVLRADSRAHSCWAQLVPLDVELVPAKVAVYLNEIQAPAQVRQAWADMQARGLAWREQYTKHARIDFDRFDGPVPMAMDIVRESASDGQYRFRAWRDGAPLPGLALELISESATRGIWRRTDTEGRIRLPALPAGRWVLRGTDLRLSAADPERWESHFVTLAFEVPGVSAAVAGMGLTAGGH